MKLGPVYGAVLSVFLARSPLEVCRPAVVSITIEMPNLVRSRRPLSHEALAEEHVNVGDDDATMDRRLYSPVAILPERLVDTIPSAVTIDEDVPLVVHAEVWMKQRALNHPTSFFGSS